MPEFKKHLIRNIILCVVLIGLFITFSYLFRLNVDHTIANILDLKEKKNFFSQSAQELSVLIEEWEAAKPYQNQVASLVPQKDSLVALSKDFQALAKKNDVTLDFSFGTETNPQSKGLGSISFTAVASGSVEEIFNFFQDIETTYYALKIGSVDLTASQEGKNARASFSGQIFFVTS